MASSVAGRAGTLFGFLGTATSTSEAGVLSFLSFLLAAAVGLFHKAKSFLLAALHVLWLFAASLFLGRYWRGARH